MNPINRKERYYQGILDGKSSDLPTPITREETYLKAIAENGGGGDESTGIWKPSVSEEGVISWEKSTSTVTPEEQNIKGPQGETGETGATGETGPAGPGLASGGVAGSLLFKSSNADYATEWVDSGIATVEGNPATANTDSAGIGIQTVVSIEPIQAGSGDPSPENVRAISGYESVEIRGCGKNMLSTSVANVKYRNSGLTWTGNSCTTNGLTFSLLTDNDGNVTGINVTGTSTNRAVLYLDNFLNGYLPGDYIVSCEKTVSDGNIYMCAFTISGDYKFFVGDAELNFYYDGLRTGSGAGNIMIEVAANKTVSCTLKPMIRLASITDAIYEPYNPVTDLTIPLGETVYGGTLDVESGTLTVDRGIYTFDGTEQWTIHSNGHCIYGGLMDMKGGNNQPGNCSLLKVGNSSGCLMLGSDNNKLCYIIGGQSVYGLTTQALTQAFTTGMQVVYPLATPYTISLPPHQIKLLQGVNNLSTNAHSISLTYRKGKVVMNSDLEGLADSVEGIGSVVNELNSNLTKNTMTAIVGTSTNYTVTQNSTYIQSYYLTRGNYVFVNIILDCVTPSTSWEAVCPAGNIPNVEGFTTIDLGALMPDDITVTDKIRLLMQSGILYAKGGTAEKRYGGCFVYPLRL